jgi:hypothetical protein
MIIEIMCNQADLRAMAGGVPVLFLQGSKVKKPRKLFLSYREIFRG